MSVINISKLFNRLVAAVSPDSALGLRAENDRMRELLAQKLVDSTMLTGLTPDAGGITLGFKGGACALLADAFAEQLFASSAQNYIEVSFTSKKRQDMGQIVVTVKRETGKTPHQLRMEAEQERDQLKAEVGARDALVIELPSRHSEKYQEYFDDVEGGSFNAAKYFDGVKAAIEAAGVKVRIAQ